MSPTETAEKASRLIAFGLRPKLRPAIDEEYGKLVSLYRADSHFRHITDAMAAGLRLRVIAADQSGLYLAAEDDSAFAYTLADFRRERGLSEVAGTAQRGLYGLIVVGIAAYYYPRAQHLVDERHPSASAADIDSFIRGVCDELRTRLGNQDPTFCTLDNEPAWWYYLRQRETSSGSDGRRGQRGTCPAVEKTLEVFAEYDLVQKVHTSQGLRYQAMERFRLQVARFAGNLLFDVLSDMRQRDRTPASEVS
ncbi:MAG: hypothetical protein HYY30_10995 [Chloroflexi bacterium]|nr:hypothetical protein [Chloroflexota bacterium]